MARDKKFASTQRIIECGIGVQNNQRDIENKFTLKILNNELMQSKICNDQ